MRDKDISSLRFVLAGYGLPAEYALCELFAAGVEPDQILILSQPADERNGGLIAQAQLRGVDFVLEPASRPTAVARVREHRPDIVASVHYRSRIPGAILAEARIGTLNLHPSLLPRYRGTNSVAWAIANGEATTGFTYHSMTEEFDTGRILIQEEFAIRPGETAFSLFHRQIARAMPRLAEALRLVASGTEGAPQEGQASYFGRGVLYGGLIDPAWDEAKIERFIRAMHFPPFEPARVEIGGVSHLVPSIETYRALIAS